MDRPLLATSKSEASLTLSHLQQERLHAVSESAEKGPRIHAEVSHLAMVWIGLSYANFRSEGYQKYYQNFKKYVVTRDNNFLVKSAF